jgi:alpha-L-fucosidase
VHVKVDQTKGEFSIRVEGSPAYNLLMLRLSDTGEEAFSHTGEANLSTDTTIIPYGMWAGNGTPLLLNIDHDSDGTIDETIMADDEN